MDETVAEELRFHQQTVGSDDHSPLHLIREKELEISGRMMAAKRKADEIVSNARRQAAEIVAAAQDDAKEMARARDRVVTAELEQQVKQVQADAERGVVEIEKTIEQQREAAVSYVVDSILG